MLVPLGLNGGGSLHHHALCTHGTPLCFRCPQTAILCPYETRFYDVIGLSTFSSLPFVILCWTVDGYGQSSIQNIGRVNWLLHEQTEMLSPFNLGFVPSKHPVGLYAYQGASEVVNTFQHHLTKPKINTIRHYFKKFISVAVLLKLQYQPPSHVVYKHVLPIWLVIISIVITHGTVALQTLGLWLEHVIIPIKSHMRTNVAGMNVR